MHNEVEALSGYAFGGSSCSYVRLGRNFRSSEPHVDDVWGAGSQMREIGWVRSELPGLGLFSAVNRTVSKSLTSAQRPIPPL